MAVDRWLLAMWGGRARGRVRVSESAGPREVAVQGRREEPPPQLERLRKRMHASAGRLVPGRGGSFGVAVVGSSGCVAFVCVSSFVVPGVDARRGVEREGLRGVVKDRLAWCCCERLPQPDEPRRYLYHTRCVRDLREREREKERDLRTGSPVLVGT